MFGKKTTWMLVLSSMAATGFLNAQASPWTEVDSSTFGILKSLFRCQGLTSDHQGNFWFSCNQSLSRSLSWTGPTEDANDKPFPDELRAQGANHIGDIDYYQGKIIAPIEDGHSYKHPFIGIYDAQYMQLEKAIPLQHDLQPDGVPWATVDADDGYIMTSQYHDTTRINLFDLQSGEFRKQIPMSLKLQAIQGGKYRNHHLYLTADDPSGGHALFDMDLGSGVVEKMIHLNDEIVEVEGLSIEGKDDLEFYILGGKGGGLGRRMVLYHWKR